MPTSDQSFKQLYSRLLKLQSIFLYVKDTKLEERLERLTQKIQYTIYLSDNSSIAVAGLQSAGKTTLLREYLHQGGEKNEWLQGNEGRGETYPVILQPATDRDLRGKICWYELDKSTLVLNAKDQEINTPDEFTANLKNGMSKEWRKERINPQFILPISQRKLLGTASFLLLPGLEAKNPRQDWQDLMKHALLSSGSCIFVCDETRLNREENEKFLREIFEELKELPVIVMTKTESLDGDGEEKIVNRLAQLSGAKVGDVKSKVIFSGVDKESGWKEALDDLLSVRVASSAQSARRQLSMLKNVITDEMDPLLDEITEAARLRAEQMDQRGSRELSEYLKQYNASIHELRKQFQKAVETGAEAQLRTFHDRVDTLYEKDGPRSMSGVDRFFKRIGDVFLGERPEDRVALERDIKKSWEGIVEETGGNEFRVHVRQGAFKVLQESGFLGHNGSGPLIGAGNQVVAELPNLGSLNLLVGGQKKESSGDARDLPATLEAIALITYSDFLELDRVPQFWAGPLTTTSTDSRATPTEFIVKSGDSAIKSMELLGSIGLTAASPWVAAGVAIADLTVSVLSQAASRASAERDLMLRTGTLISKNLQDRFMRDLDDRCDAVHSLLVRKVREYSGYKSSVGDLLETEHLVASCHQIGLTILEEIKSERQTLVG